MLEDFGLMARYMRDDEKAQIEALTGEPYDADRVARLFANVPGPVYACLGRDGFPLLVGGFIPQRPGVYRAWMAGTQAGWDAHGRTYSRMARRAIRAMLATGAHRVEIVSLANRLSAHNWYERHLGLRDEGVSVGWFADGQDARTHAIIRRKEA
ncbi:MAG: hypothetical protein ACREER_12085 [Alphaproteobacteria bacterium]